MTKAEAADVLDMWSATGQLDDPCSIFKFEATMDKVEEALNMAVEALRNKEG